MTARTASGRDDAAPRSDPDPRPLIIVAASLDSFGLADVGLLQEASRIGRVHVRLSSDSLIGARTGEPSRFPQGERLFIARSVRYVDGASIVHVADSALRPVAGEWPGAVLVGPADDDPLLRAACERRGIAYRVVSGAGPSGAATEDLPASDPNARRVIVTGCYDWLHSGHVEFFREASALGELYVVVGSDRNVRLLKGPGHPLRTQDERRYMVQAIRSVHRAAISTGHGWMDAEPEMASIQPHVYVVNEDGDQPEKRDFCRAHGIEYAVLRRRPHRGLPRRTSTDLRGF